MNSIWNALAIPVEGVLGFIVGYTLERIGEYRLAKRRLSLLRHVLPFEAVDETALFLNYLRPWRVPVGKPHITINCSRVSKVDGLAIPLSLREYVHSAEVLALIKIAAAMHACSVDLDVNQFYDFPTDARFHVLIGSHAHNKLSTSLLADLGHMKHIPRAEDHAYFIYKNALKTCSHDQGKVIRDYGIIVRRSYHGNQWKLLFAGIHMHGTLGAVEVALMEEFQVRVRDLRLKCFAQLVEVTVAPDGLGVPKSEIKWKEFEPIKLEPV